jgi:hypothetical protein
VGRTSTSKRLAQLGRLALGYTPRAGVPSLRSAAGVVLTVSAAAVFVGTTVLCREQPVDQAADVHVLVRLDDFTKAAGPTVKNTIPAFLKAQGKLGALVDDPPGTVTLQDVSEADLLSGFCTASLSGLVRQIYPGTYDELSDAVLEQRVRATHPEYRDRLCSLPPWMPTPQEIVKYEIVRRASFVPSPRAVGWGLAATLLFGFVAGNAYYRLLLSRGPA